MEVSERNQLLIEYVTMDFPQQKEKKTKNKKPFVADSKILLKCCLQS
jgi:hypothetical protein